MNRAQMVEKAAVAALRARHATLLEWRWDRVTQAKRTKARGQARAVLDAILPQVATVAELETLPWGTVLLSVFGVPYIWYADEKRLRVGNHRFIPIDALADGLLTVVWTPEVAS